MINIMDIIIKPCLTYLVMCTSVCPKVILAVFQELVKTFSKWLVKDFIYFLNKSNHVSKNCQQSSQEKSWMSAEISITTLEG